jgi:hypothetical protein
MPLIPDQTGRQISLPMPGMIRSRKYPQDLALDNLQVKCIYLVTIALCGGRPRNAEKIKTHGHEVGLCDKGGMKKMKSEK